MAGTAKAGAAKTSAPPAKLGKAPAKVAPPTKAKPAAKPKGATAGKAPVVAAVSLAFPRFHGQCYAAEAAAWNAATFCSGVM
jgi:hypothetical protein